MQEKHVKLYTPDDWYPNYPNNEVELSIINLSDGQFRVCVWGNDDFGMEKDFNSADLAEQTYDTIKNSGVVTKEDLYVMGFETA